MKFFHKPVASFEDVTHNFEQLEAAIPSPVTALPVSAADGQPIVYIADTTNDIAWTFRYRQASSSTHRWVLVGGSEMMTASAGSVTTSSTTFVAITSGPSVTVPLAGDYAVFFQVFAQQQVAGSNNMQASIAKNGTAAGLTTNFVGVAQFNGGYQSIKQTVTGLAAGDVLTVQGKTPNALSTIFSNALITIRPTRVG